MVDRIVFFAQRCARVQPTATASCDWQTLARGDFLLTKHGVRDLNGPKLDGRYNGRRYTCGHYRDPSMGTTIMTRIDGTKVHCCAECGEERFPDAAD